ncbi:hypothetical protein TEA_017718 [Camellia sinensis var. sinensis]|uniref:Sugar phosphate transporter domain-containing protein n=1 Tax=Camellia sinensis var. sinensis TaxID=542762 RepID=A0A4S4DBF7_CAMSN|nr:hypothetical protein TEA_017718 [Camellia sinensis var. sinensis]
MILISWATRIAEAPKTDLEFWKNLFPVVGEHTIGRVEDKLRFGVAVAHTIWHVAATVSMSKIAVSFTHIIKSGEPAFSVLVSRFLMGETFPVPVYLSLIPIIGGCGLAAVTELNFNMTGGWRPRACSITSTITLNEISPLTLSIGNTMKRISVIVSSIIIFHTPVQPVNALGAAIAILGTFLYSQVPYVSFIATLSCCIVHYFPNFVTSSAFIMCKAVRKLESGNLGMFCNIDDLEKICCEDLFGLDDDSSIHCHRGSKKANQELFFL